MIRSLNPATGQVEAEFAPLSAAAAMAKLDQAETAYQSWRRTSLARRRRLLLTLAQLLRQERDRFAPFITREMGKLIGEARAEIEKCAWLCEYYAGTGARHLRPQRVKTEARDTYVRFDPLGVVLAVMPWNFPFWQVFRQAVPAILAGNTVLLKHASAVPRTALLIEESWRRAGFPPAVFQSLLIEAKQLAPLLADRRVRQVSLTGSEAAGRAVARGAAAALKPSVLELGGSDAFIVLADADLAEAAKVAASARLIATGQSCIAAKRFLIEASVYESFLVRLGEEFARLKAGDPLAPETNLGPLISEAARDELHRQVQTALDEGARLVVGGRALPGAGFYYAPTILAEVRPEMKLVQEEVFGPVAAVMAVASAEEALAVANASRFGLGASVWTQNPLLQRRFIRELEVGSVFINSLVKSDPRLPFGGVKDSGYGRELAQFGLRSFINIKTVWIA